MPRTRYPSSNTHYPSYFVDPQLMKRISDALRRIFDNHNVIIEETVYQSTASKITHLLSLEMSLIMEPAPTKELMINELIRVQRHLDGLEAAYADLSQYTDLELFDDNHEVKTDVYTVILRESIRVSKALQRIRKEKISRTSKFGSGLIDCLASAYVSSFDNHDAYINERDAFDSNASTKTFKLICKDIFDCLSANISAGVANGGDADELQQKIIDKFNATLKPQSTGALYKNIQNTLRNRRMRIQLCFIEEMFEAYNHCH